MALLCLKREAPSEGEMLCTLPHHGLPSNLDLGTSLSFLLWVLPTSSSTASLLPSYLIWVDSLDSRSLTLFPYSVFSSGLSTPTFPLSQGSAPSHILCPTAIQPQPKVFWNELYTIPNIRKEFFCPSPSNGFSFYESYLMLCSDWVSWRRFCWVKLRGWFC